jgi:hypothetical protein
MSIEKAVSEKLLKLPANMQKEVLDFVETRNADKWSSRWTATAEKPK